MSLKLENNDLNNYNLTFNGSVLTGGIGSGDILIGEIILWPNNTNIPSGFLPCDGSEYTTDVDSEYYDLYSIIGLKYGSGTGTFKVPYLNNTDDDLNSTSSNSYYMAKSSSYTNDGVDTYANLYENNITELKTKNNSYIDDIPGHSHGINVSTNRSLSYDLINVPVLLRGVPNPSGLGTGLGGNNSIQMEAFRDHDHQLTPTFSNTTNQLIYNPTNLSSNVTINATSNNNLNIIGNFNYNATTSNLTDNTNTHTQKKYLPKSIKLYYLICYKGN